MPPVSLRRHPGGKKVIREFARSLPGPNTPRWLQWKIRSVQAVIALIIGVIVLSLLGGLGASAFLVWLVFAAIWIPPYERMFRYGKYIRPVFALVLAVTYPFYWSHMFTIPVLGSWPDVPTGVVMLVFIMMAVGLNIVVGYAGLLDLGYVAFYAMGAYPAAWFPSVQFPSHNVHFWAVGVGSNVPGFHISIWLLL